MGEVVFSTDEVGTIGYLYTERRIWELNCTLFTKITSKGVIPSVKAVQFLEENMGVNLHDLGVGNDFLETAPKAQAINEIT